MRAGLYEGAATRLFATIVKPGMTVVDLGANIGYYTVLSSRLTGTEGRVYSFEPDSRAYAYLRRNIEANRSANVDAFRLAVGESGKTSWFNPDPHLAEGYLTSGSGKHRTRVEVISLDEFFSKHQWPPVDLVKMDVEGSEGSALKGMRQLASKNKQMRLVMELSLNALHRTNASTRSIALSLQALGYSSGYIVERNMKPFQVEDGLPVSSATYNLLFAR